MHVCGAYPIFLSIGVDSFQVEASARSMLADRPLVHHRSSSPMHGYSAVPRSVVSFQSMSIRETVSKPSGLT